MTQPALQETPATVLLDQIEQKAHMLGKIYDEDPEKLALMKSKLRTDLDAYKAEALRRMNW